MRRILHFIAASLLLAAALAWSGNAGAQVELTGGTYIDYVGVRANGIMLNEDGHSMRYYGTTAGVWTGDAYNPGSPYWSFSVEATDGTGNFVVTNNLNSGAETTEIATTSGPAISGRTIFWSGEYVSGARHIGVDLTYTHQVDDSHILIQAVVTNLGAEDLTEVYMSFGDEPDHGQALSGDYATLNDVVRQPPTDGSALRFNAIDTPSVFVIASGSMDPRCRVSSTWTGFPPDPSDLWNSPLDDDGALSDMYSGLAFKEDTLAAGASTTFVWAYVWAESYADAEAGFDTLSWGECGNGTVEPGEECDDANVDNTDDCLDTCLSATCGDGFVQAGVEECDDANVDNTDDCLDTCLSATCGDGFVQAGVEECDEGTDNSDTETDACRTTCLEAHCGDSVIDTDEACDDGNDDNTDGCIDTCESATCGDGFVQDGVETCDDGNDDNTDGCIDTCESATCGDGFVQADVEECDEGTDNSDTEADACRTTCLEAHCGDSVIDTDEACDDGNDDNTDGCIDTCESATCGDGFVQGGVEECDDGNTDDGDGCSASCTVEVSATCGDGVVDDGEQCDDGNIDNTDDCVDGCMDAACGDGFLHDGVEECDDANTDDGDGCSASCTVEVSATCGDGVVDDGEQCDDGANVSGDGCSASCMLEDGWICEDEPSVCCEDLDADGDCDEVWDPPASSTGCGCTVVGSDSASPAIPLGLILAALGLFALIRRRV